MLARSVLRRKAVVFVGLANVGDRDFTIMQSHS
jgi:hypothetical protein